MVENAQKMGILEYLREKIWGFWNFNLILHSEQGFILIAIIIACFPASR